MFMKEIQLPNPTRLLVVYDGKRVEFAYPPIMGHHQECFEAIKADGELRASEGVEMALLTHGAYNGEGLWNSVRKLFRESYVRAPQRFLWIPKGTLEDKSLSGVLVERASEGLGSSDKIEIPNLTEWRQNERGVYVSSGGNQVFIPKDRYKLRDHNANSFANDCFAVSVLSFKGAEIFAKTAVDAGLIPNILGLDVDSLQNPDQRVCLLKECSNRLGFHVWDNYRDGRAFGVFKSPRQVA